MNLGDFVKEYRTAHNLSQRQFALQCGLSNGYISLIEKGINPKTKKPITPTLPQLRKLTEGMGITINELLEKVDDMPIDLSEPASAIPLSLCGTLDGKQLSPEEADLLRKFRALDDSGKGRVVNVLDYEYNALPGSEINSVPKEA